MVPIADREYCAGDFDTCFDKETRFRPFPPYPQGVQLVCHGKSRHLVGRFPRDGKAEQEQQPLPNLPISPVVRAELSDHRPVRQSAAKIAASVQQMQPPPIRKRDRLDGGEIGIS